MSIKILHTSDWHIGQRFYDYDRTLEHLHFFHWLIQTIIDEQVDVLLVSGDLFDVANPSSDAQHIYYSFLTQLKQRVPELQVVIVAGNHDSASRLEAPSSLLQEMGITVIGHVPYQEEKIHSIQEENSKSIQKGNIRSTQEKRIKFIQEEKIKSTQGAQTQSIKEEIQKINSDYLSRKDIRSLIVPLHNRNNEVKACCLAVPYLRPGDYPINRNVENPYLWGVKQFYDLLVQEASKMIEDVPLVAMGHLHTSNASLSDSERDIRGGLEMVDPNSFNEHIIYTALGHIHKAQCVNKQNQIYYSGSPIPMSFSEIHYQHRVIVVKIDHDKVSSIEEKPIPRLIELQRIGTRSKPITKDRIFDELNSLPSLKENEIKTAPYLEINLYLEEPDVLINQQIRQVIEQKHVRLTHIQAFYPKCEGGDDAIQLSGIESFQKISPTDMFINYYRKKNNADVPETLLNLFKSCLDV